MSNIIDKIQLSGVTYDIGGGGGSITIDPTLDSGSTNAVANSAITLAIDEKVNIADNIVSARTINYSYDAGDTNYKYPYNNGLIINEFYVKPVNQYAYTNTAAWSSIYITNGSSYTGIKVNVDCSNYQITAVTSTSGENFTYAIEDSVLHITLSEGYTVQSIQQNSNFVISFTKYTIESGQTADVINEDLIDVIQDIYDQTPKAYLTAATPNLSSTRLTIQNYKSDGSNSGQYISFGSSIKGDNNKMDAYLPSRYTTGVTLNTGTGNYCQVPSSTVDDYNTGFAYMDLAVNTGYTGSSTSFTFTVKTLFNNNTVQTDTFTYDVVNKTIGGNQSYIDVFYVNNTISIYPKQYRFSRIQSVSEPNCKIGGVDSPLYFKNQYIITGVTGASYTKQANTVINEIYSELNGKATTTYVDQSTSGKVDTSVYTAYTAATDTALAGKQTTLTAGTGIDITDNVISATGGGGCNPTVELTQAEYDALVTAGTVSADTYYIITDAQAGDLTQYWTSAQTQSAITQATSGKVDTSTYNTYTAATDTALSNKQTTLTAGTGISIVDNVISATGGGSVTVDTELDSGSTNPVQNQALYNELRLNVTEQTETLLQWEQNDGGESTNYPSGCTKITVEVDENEMTYGGYTLYNNNHDCFGVFVIESNGGVITVSTIDCESEPITSITYSISGNVVTIEYPTITNVTIIGTSYDNYWTIKAISGTSTVTPLIDQVSANTTALAGKQTTLTAGTGIDITDNVISATGGGGKAIEVGRGIAITTGETADTISFNLPISAGTKSTNLIIGEATNISNANRSIATGYKTKAQQSNAFAQGYQTDAGQENSHAEGYQTKAYGVNSHSEGRDTSAMTVGSHAEGLRTITSNSYEHTQGQYNVSNKANTTFGDSGNTLFSVGNGTADNARHNAFEIRQNGDIYLNNGTSDVKLQEYLQIKAVKVTQAEYDALVQGGTVDANTLYIITNVVS